MQSKQLYTQYMTHALTSLGLLLFSIWLLQTGCASVGSPSGGPKDTIPPNISESIPKRQTVSFKGNTITLNFDEYITAAKLKSEMIITPYYDGDLEIKTRGKQITLVFNDPLRDSTTYTLYFRKGITDITEKNPLKEDKFIFSTGSFIDSMEIKGKIEDQYLNKPLKNTLILLYDSKDTFYFPEHNPMYLAETNKEGKYEIKNIKIGEYFIYALSGSNGKVKYKSRDQYVGFLPNAITIDSITTLDLACQTYNVKPFSIIRARAKRQYYEIMTNRGIAKAKINMLTPQLLDSVVYLVNNDLIRFFNHTNTNIDSALIEVILNDSANNRIIDTLKLKYDIDSKKEKFDFKILKDNFQIQENNQNPIISPFTKPILSILKDSIWIMNDEDTAKYRGKIEIRGYDTLVFDTILQKRTTIQLRKGSIVSIEQDTLQEKLVKVNMINPEDYGIIGGTITADYPSYIVQLLDQKKNVLAEARNTNKFRFELVPPGEKLIRVLIDTNLNGQWDKGSFDDRIPPEPVYFFDQKIELKANWEMVDYQIIVP